MQDICEEEELAVDIHNQEIWDYVKNWLHRVHPEIAATFTCAKFEKLVIAVCK
jgi:hypothetical protein